MAVIKRGQQNEKPRKPIDQEPDVENKEGTVKTFIGDLATR